MWEALHLSGFKVADWFGQVDISQQDILVFLEGTQVWFKYSYLPTWPFKDQMPTHTLHTHTPHTRAHTLVSKSTYVTLFLSYKRGFGK